MFFRFCVLSFIAMIVLVGRPLSALAADFDLSITAADISFQPLRAIVNQSSRVTISVSNIGTQDAEGVLQLFDGDTIVSSKAVSAKTQGRPDDAWMTWRPTSIGLHTLHIRLIGDINGRDEDLSNNNVDLSVVVDGDQDGDGVGDAVDPDIDGDGVKNADDAYPFDAARSQIEVVKPVVVPVAISPSKPAVVPAPTLTKTVVPLAKMVVPVTKPIEKEPTLTSASIVKPAPVLDKDTPITPASTSTFTSPVPAVIAPSIPPPKQAVIMPTSTVQVDVIDTSTPTSTYVLAAGAGLSALLGLFFLLRGKSLGA